MTKSVTVGVYPLGCMSIRLVANDRRGGTVSTANTGEMLMVIGCGDDWPLAVTTLLHEAFEIASAELRTRWSSHPDFACDSGGFLFVMTHPEMAEIIARVGEFAAKTLPELSKAYKRVHQKGD